jgi:DedD protein
MPRYFEDEEVLEAEEPRPDTEITLGWGTIAGLVVALLVICGLCFVLGYRMGQHRPVLATPDAQTAASDQEPLQGNSSVPKPIASEQAAVPPAQPSTMAQPATAQGGESVEAGSSSVPAAAVASPQSSLPSAQTAGPAQPQVRPALPSSETLMVQVAAVKHEEDADVLIDALRKRAYPVSQYSDPVDGLIHVRVGPFASRDEANQWRMKLLNDGYNAVVQP